MNWTFLSLCLLLVFITQGSGEESGMNEYIIIVHFVCSWFGEVYKKISRFM